MFYNFDFTKLSNLSKFTTIRVNDIIEISIIIIILYYILKNIKGTRAWTLTKGCVMLFILYGVAYFASFNVITFISSGLFTFLVTALVIMFQPELRKILESLGKKNITIKKIVSLVEKNKENNDLYTTKSIEEIIKSVNTMSKAKTGALILVERKNSLIDYENSGIMLNADISSQLIINAFEKNTPLHDGAMIIRGNKITAATCYLPLSDNRNIDKKLGTRHRAAIGASEETDALVIVVSEETGAISIVENGKIKHNVSVEKLRETLVDNQTIVNLSPTTETKKKHRTKLWVLSVIFGICLWAFVTITVDPVVTVDFDNIPVEVINDSALKDDGHIYEVIKGDTVDISVTGQKSYLSDLTVDSFTAVADASEVSITNSISVSVRSKFNNSHITIDTHNALLTVSIEEKSSVECSVFVEKKGKEADGFFVSSIAPLSKTVTITGPKSVVKTADKAVATVDVSHISDDFTDEVSFIIYDRNGDPLDLKYCELSIQQVEVEGTISHTKTVPLNITAFDSSLEDCEVVIDDLSITQQEIEISATNEILETVESIDVNIDIATMPQKINTRIDMQNYMPEGVSYASNRTEFDLTMEVRRLVEQSIMVNSHQISMKNGSGIIHNSACEVTVKYDYANPDSIKLDNLKPFINLEGLDVGTHDLMLEFEKVDGVEIVKNDEISITIM